MWHVLILAKLQIAESIKNFISTHILSSILIAFDKWRDEGIHFEKLDKSGIMCNKIQTTNSESHLKMHHFVYWANGPHRKRLNAIREASSRDQPTPSDKYFLVWYSEMDICLWSYCSLPCWGFLFWVNIVWNTGPRDDPQVIREDATLPQQCRHKLQD